MDDRPVESPRHTRLVVAFALLAVLLRVPALLFPVFSEEEAAEAAVSALAARGATLYRDVPAPDPPLAYFTTAAVYAVGGELAGRATHVATFFPLLAAMAVLAMAGRALGGDRGRTLAALFFGVFSAALPPAAFGANSEWWSAFAAAVCAWLVLGGAPSRRYGVLFAAGAMAAVGALYRHETLAIVPASLLYLCVWRPAMLGRARFAPGALGSVSFLLGFAVPYAVALAYLQSRDALDAFAQSVWIRGATDPRSALAHVGLCILGLGLLWFFAVREVARTTRGWRIEDDSLAPAASVTPDDPHGAEMPAIDLRPGRALRGEDDASVAYVATWLALAIVALCVRARFGGGDFVALLAPLVLLAARGAATIADDFWTGRLARGFRLGIAVPVALFVGLGLFHDTFYRKLDERHARMRPLVNAILSRSSSADRVLAVGRASRLYVYARRLPPEGFLGSERAARPRFIVDVTRPPANAATATPFGYEFVELVDGAHRLFRRIDP
jgi:hypothetical protein